MNLVYNIGINVYSIMILAIISYQALKLVEKDSLQDKLFIKLLFCTILLLFVDILSRFDGTASTLYPIINQFGNFLVYLLNPILPSIWLAYVHFQIFRDERRTKKLVYPLFAINFINTAILIMSQFSGWYYYIDADNIYHRGPLFLFTAFLTILVVLTAFVITIINHEKLERKTFLSLIFFALPPFACILLQIAFYGISLMLNGVTLSLLVVFLNIQNKNIYIDFLTGVNNRKKLDVYLKNKVNTSTKDKTFSAILIDLNNFKYINDTFGHDMGDKALEIVAKLLESCLRSNDFIARYGGDEFLIVLDISTRIELEAMVERINNCVAKYNESNSQPYELGFSMGYAIYDYNSQMNAEQFQKQIDLLMYENKHARNIKSIDRGRINHVS